MAGAILNVGLLLIKRRGYSTVSTMGKRGGLMDPKGTASVTVPSSMLNSQNSTMTSWVPDPVTGYYRPDNKHTEIDVAEMRAQLLSLHKHQP